MDTPITRAEHEEFRRRLEEENARQDKRIALLEENTKRLEILNTSIEKLAVNMESMVKEQIRQGSRLQALEDRDGAKWRKTMGYIAATAIGAILSFIFDKIIG